MNQIKFTAVIILLLLVISFQIACVKGIPVEPQRFADLVIEVVSQHPSPARSGDPVKLYVTICNRGDAPSAPSDVRLWNESGEIIANQNITTLYPGVSLGLEFDLPSSDASYGVRIIIDPEQKINEKDISGNELETEIRIVSEEDYKKVEDDRAKKFEADMKQNLVQNCPGKLSILQFRRIDKMMDYDRANEGDRVEIVIELQNQCKHELREMTLQWVAGNSGNTEIFNTLFGANHIKRLKPGEKFITKRIWPAARGNWIISVKIIPGGLIDTEESINRSLRIKVSN